MSHDGSCLFDGVGFAILINNDNNLVPNHSQIKQLGSELRKKVVEILKDEIDSYAIFMAHSLADLGIVVNNELDKKTDMEKALIYIDAMGNREVWGGAIELMVLAKISSVSYGMHGGIRVFSKEITGKDNDKVNFKCISHFESSNIDDNNNGSINLLLENHHYTLLHNFNKNSQIITINT